LKQLSLTSKTSFCFEKKISQTYFETKKFIFSFALRKENLPVSTTEKMPFGLSFDIGYRRFGTCFYERNEQEFTILYWSRKDFGVDPRHPDFDHCFARFMFKLFLLLDTLTFGQDVTNVLIERQVFRNPKARLIQTKLMNVLNQFKDREVRGIRTGIRKVTTVHANSKRSWYKRQALEFKIKRGRAGYDARKKAAVTATEMLLPGSSLASWKKAGAVADLADCLVQALAFEFCLKKNNKKMK